MRIPTIQYQQISRPIFFEPETVTESRWHQAWSEPVRFRHIHVSQIVSGLTWNPQQPLPPTSIWYRPLDEPVRIPLRLPAALNRFEFIDTEAIPRPDTIFSAWYPSFTEPVRFLAGTRTPYHWDFFYHPRVLPPADVTVSFAATEVNEDVALFAVEVSDPEPTPSSQEGASVTIVEVPAQQDGAASIREP